ncbi:MAG TPA: hypothetical protein VJT31_28500 [Rugosimonospora sp.]|nr:hypothetical protein [Rugosimonospora sp.]
MTAAHPPGSDGDPPPGTRSPGFAVVALIVALMLLLMGFSICAVLLHEPALATVAGTAAVALAGDTVRRFLPPGSTPPGVGPPAPRGEAEPPPEG